MTAIRSSKLVGPVSITLAALLLLLSVPASVLPTAEAAGQDRLLLLFPVLDRSESGYAEVGERATDYLQMAISDIAGMRVTEFSRTSPMVRRAVEEGQIRSVDLEGEVTDPVTAIQMGYALGADDVCMATVMSIETRGEPAQVEVLLNGTCYGVQENVDPETMQIAERPKPASSFGVTGTSRERLGYTGTMPPLVREALMDAARRAAHVLAGKPAEQMAAEEAAAKRDTGAWRWALAALVIGGLVLAASSDDDTGAPRREAVAPQPLRLQIEPAAIRLFWDPPLTTLTVLRYDIQRSTDNGMTWNPVPGSQGNVEASDTSFADFDVHEGVSYRYRIRAQYTTAGPSPFAEFQSVEFPG
ncbi:MAG: fibronectin type III domain-containing protein [Armatimonadota bacterium]